MRSDHEAPQSLAMHPPWGEEERCDTRRLLRRKIPPNRFLVRLFCAS